MNGITIPNAIVFSTPYKFNNTFFFKYILFLCLILSANTIEAQSTDSSLSTLTVSSGTLTPAFSPTTFNYNVVLGYLTTTVTIAAEPNDINAMVTGTGVKSLSVGDNIYIITVTAEDGVTMSTYSINIRRQSNNANLSSLSLSVGNLSPAFSPSTTSYSSVVSYISSSTIISATAVHSGAVVNGTGTKSLSVGDNNYSIVVTAEDPNYTKTYNVVIRRQSNNADLSSLSLSVGTLSPAFSPSTTSYNSTVSFVTSSTVISATAVHSGAVVNGTGTMSLSVGDNNYSIVVTAEDPNYTKTYNVVIRRQSNNADLSSLSLSTGSLMPTFSPSVTSYSVTVPYPASNTVASAMSSDSNAMISGDGNLLLSVGDNSFDIVVTAEDPNYTKTYNIIIRRLNNDANLSALYIDFASLNPSFSPSITSYNTSVTSYINYVNIYATANDYNATITGNEGVSLDFGDNSFEIIVTAEDPNFTKTYTLIIRRLSNNTYLSSLSITPESFTPSFDKMILYYTADYDNADSYTTITAIAEDSNAMVTGTGMISLVEGQNLLEVTVTAEDSNYSRIYYINISRKFLPGEISANLSENIFFDGDGSHGIIMKSPSGACYKIIMLDDGKTETISVECPE